MTAQLEHALEQSSESPLSGALDDQHALVIFNAESPGLEGMVLLGCEYRIPDISLLGKSRRCMAETACRFRAAGHTLIVFPGSLLSAILPCPLPDGSLLSRYRLQQGAYTDCYSTEIAGSVSQAEFVEAFYTTWVFKLERAILNGPPPNHPPIRKQPCLHKAVWMRSLHGLSKTGAKTNCCCATCTAAPDHG